MSEPKGRRPKHISSWLEIHGQDEWPFLICPTCDGWIDEIDKFLPYHFEMNRCYKCDGKRKFVSLGVSVHSQQEFS